MNSPRLDRIPSPQAEQREARLASEAEARLTFVPEGVSSAGAVIVKGMVNRALTGLGLPPLARSCEVPEFKLTLKDSPEPLALAPGQSSVRRRLGLKYSVVTPG